MDTGKIKVKVNDKDAGCLISLGSIKMKRDIKEYEPINCDEVLQAQGLLKVDPIQVGVEYEPTDAAGQKELNDAFMNGTRVTFSIELDDMPDGGTNGTTFSWDNVLIGEYEINPEPKGKVIATFSVSVTKKPTITAAA